MTLAGWLHLLFFGVFVPIGAYRTGKRLVAAPALPPRRRYYQTVLVQLALFAAMSIAVALVQRIDLVPRVAPNAVSIAAGVAGYVAAVLIMRPRWRRAVEQKRRIVSLFSPADSVERALWIAVAIGAGISEEITWRGVQTPLLTMLIGSRPAAAAVSCLLFALAHATQGRRTVIAILPFAAMFEALVWLSGSLVVAIVVHAAYDITAGMAYGRLRWRLRDNDRAQPRVKIISL